MPDGGLTAQLELLAIFAAVGAFLLLLVRKDMKATRKLNRQIGLDAFGERARGWSWWKRAPFAFVMLLLLLLLALAPVMKHWRH